MPWIGPDNRSLRRVERLAAVLRAGFFADLRMGRLLAAFFRLADFFALAFLRVAFFAVGFFFVERFLRAFFVDFLADFLRLPRLDLATFFFLLAFFRVAFVTFLRVADFFFVAFFFVSFFLVAFFLVTFDFLLAGFLRATDLRFAVFFRVALAALLFLLAAFLAGISYSCRPRKTRNYTSLSATWKGQESVLFQGRSAMFRGSRGGG